MYFHSTQSAVVCCAFAVVTIYPQHHAGLWADTQHTPQRPLFYPMDGADD